LVSNIDMGTSFRADEHDRAPAGVDQVSFAPLTFGPQKSPWDDTEWVGRRGDNPPMLRFEIM
jgi:hypothetical protein